MITPFCQKTPLKIISGQNVKKQLHIIAKHFVFRLLTGQSVVAEELKGTDLLVGAGIGFPFGQQSSAVKAFEAEEAVRMGATVLDSCMNVGALKDKKYDEVLQEFRDYKKAAGPVMTKMILDTEFLTAEEIATACKLIAEAELDWAKSASGQWVGPSMEDVPDYG